MSFIKFSNICLLLLAIIISLIAAEFLLRIFIPVEGIFIENDSLLGYRHIPNQKGIWIRECSEPNRIQINSKGLRDTEHEYVKMQETFRILLLGDSFIQAFQVKMEEMLSKQLESRLSLKSQNITFEVINSGVQGYSTGIEKLYLETEGKKYNPDLVILYLFAGNDIYENYYKSTSETKPRWKMDGDNLIKLAPSGNRAYILLRDKILTKSYLCRLVRIAALKFNIKTILGVGYKAGLLSGEYSIPAETQDKIEAMRVTETLLLELNEYVINTLNKTLVIFVIPDGAIFHPDIYSAATNENLANFNEIIRFLKSNNFYYVNPYEKYLNTIPEKELYIAKAGHWTPAGNELSAQLTFDFLLNNKLIPIPAKMNNTT